MLLILAGVTIAMLTGENGILTQSSKATVTQIEANVDERVRLAVQGCKIAIANETARDQSWSAVTDGIKPSDNKLDRASASGLTDETTNGVILASIAEDLKDTGYFISATTPTGEGTTATRDMVIEYSGDDYKKATNNTNAKIEYTLNITQHEVKIAGIQIGSGESSQGGGDNQGGDDSQGSGSGTGESETSSKTVADLEEGDEVVYIDKNGNKIDCIVLYDSTSGYGVQIISKDTVGDNIELGNGTGTQQTDATSFATAKESYNTAIAKLNTAAKSYLNTELSPANGARCVGSSPSGTPVYEEENTGTYTSTSTNSSYFSKYNNQFKNSTYYSTDLDQMKKENINCFRSASKREYWITARSPHLQQSETYFSVSIVFADGLGTGGPMICRVLSSGATYSYSQKYGLRPVFTLNSGVRVVETGEKKVLVAN